MQGFCLWNWEDKSNYTGPWEGSKCTKRWANKEGKSREKRACAVNRKVPGPLKGVRIRIRGKLSDFSHFPMKTRRGECHVRLAFQLKPSSPRLSDQVTPLFWSVQSHPIMACGSVVRTRLLPLIHTPPNSHHRLRNRTSCAVLISCTHHEKVREIVSAWDQEQRSEVSGDLPSYLPFYFLHVLRFCEKLSLYLSLLTHVNK